MKLLSLLCAAAILLCGAASASAQALPQMSERSIGSAKAPVTIDEYFSLDCPHCAAFESETLPLLKAKYIDTGKVRLVLHDFPLSMMAVNAAMLARCANPDRYATMVATLFQMQHGWVLATQQESADALKQQAKFAGMSDSQVEACLGNEELQKAVIRERLDAEQRLLIDSTPTFIFNSDANDRFAGAAPFDQFETKIDSLLNK